MSRTRSRTNARTPCAGVIGLGSIGRALFHVLSFYYNSIGYDIKGNYSWDDVLLTDLVFVCVQTPLGLDKRLDCSHVTSVLEALTTSRYENPVVIRSTVRIGYMEETSAKFPNLRLVYFPEFLRERSSLQWSINPDRIVLAGAKVDVDVVSSFLGWAEEAHIIKTDFRSAELGKLAHNAFIANKVSFTNEIERVSLEKGADPRVVMEIVTADRRVKSNEHLRPYMGPYNGKCVPKDTSELVTAAGDSAILLKAIEEVNEGVKQRARIGLSNGQNSGVSPSDRGDVVKEGRSHVARVGVSSRVED